MPRALVFENEEFLISGGDDKCLIKYSILEKEISLKKIVEGRIVSMAIDGKRGVLFVAQSNNTVTLHAVASLGKISQFSENFDISCITFIGPDNIAVGGTEGELRLYDARNTREAISASKLIEGGGKINQILGLDLRNIVALTDKLQIMDTSLKVVETLNMENRSEGSLRKVVFDKKRMLLVVGGFDGKIHLIKICKLN